MEGIQINIFLFGVLQACKHVEVTYLSFWKILKTQILIDPAYRSNIRIIASTQIDVDIRAIGSKALTLKGQR